MLESTRLDYLAAMGVVGWVPRHPLAHAAFRFPPELPPFDESTAVSEVDSAAPAPLIERESKGPTQVADVIESVRASISLRAAKPGQVQPTVVPEPEPVVPEPEVVIGPPPGPFYLQLWMAGPCALLIETPEPGLESASPALQLLKDILRAVRLPQTPHLLSDFHWPLTRNPQFDRSASAASLALQAFMQGRLEGQGVVSIGCFGHHPRLLLGAEPPALDRLEGAEQVLEHLPPAWFAPTLESLMHDQQSKAQLWHKLRRIMSRWQAEQ